MTRFSRHRPPKNATMPPTGLVFTASLVMIATPRVVLAAQPEEAPNHEEFRNIISSGPLLAFHGLRQRGATNLGAPASDLLGGFSLVYERVLVPNAWALVVANAFLFKSGRFDSALDLAATRIHAFGSWELFVSLGITFDIRAFFDKRQAQEGRPNELTLGLIARTGLVRRVSKQISIGVEVGYSWIPLSAVVEHELATSLLIGYAF